MDAVPMPQLGETIRGKYRIVGKLGEGGMGIVFQALDETKNQRVAMKVLRSEMLHEPENVARFDRESRAVSQLKGPHIARVLDVDFTEGGLPFIVMELLDGHDLSTEIELRGRIEPDEAVDYVLQACIAMSEAHALGIIHRDLKPSNLFICDSGGARMVKVLDFGISKIVSDDEVRMTMTQATFGTPLYMSPEQVRSAKNVDARTDVWSLGVILYELLVGRPPFLGSTTAAAAALVTEEPPAPKGIRRDLPNGLEEVVLTALAKDAKKRYPDVDSFARALMPFAPATGPISGGRLAALQREAESNRVIKLTPGVPDAQTVLRPSRIPEIANARVRKGAPRRGWLLALGAALPIVFIGLVTAAVFVYRGGATTAITSAAAPSPPPAAATAVAPGSTGSVQASSASAAPLASSAGSAALGALRPEATAPKARPELKADHPDHQAGPPAPLPKSVPAVRPAAPGGNPTYL